MTVTEVATLLGISVDGTYDAVKRGDLPSLRVGRRIFVPTAKLAELLGIVEVSTAS